MPPKNDPKVLEQIKSIATELGIDEEKAAAVAQKCYDEVWWRPYFGATSFKELDEMQSTRDYTFAVEDETYKLRGIIENITLSDDLTVTNKVNAIQDAASEYGTRIETIKEPYGIKEILGSLKELLLPSNKVIRKEGDKWVLYTKDGKRKLGTHDTKAEAEAQEAAIEANKKSFAIEDVSSGSFKVFKDEETGDYRWLSFSSNAFEDREKELFSTSALEEAVDYAEKNDSRGPLMVYHIPGTEIGNCDFQAVQGRFLVESGIFDDTPMGNKALQYFLTTDEDHQVSIGYQYKEGDEEDGTYDWLRFRERSVCPMGTAANPWTDFQVFGGKEMDDQHKSQLVKMFGEEMATQVIQSAEDKTKELTEQGVRYKADPKEESGTSDSEAFIRKLAKELEVDENKALEVAKKVASSYSEDNKEDKKEEETAVPAQPQIDATKWQEMAQLMADMAEKVDSLTNQVKELKSSDDEKIANAVAPRLNIEALKASESNGNLVDGSRAKDILGEVDAANVNPATKYVEDILGPLSRAGSN